MNFWQSSGGVRETIAAVALPEAAERGAEVPRPSSRLRAEKNLRAGAVPLVQQQVDARRGACTATDSMAAGASRVRRCVAVSASSRNRSSTRLGPSAAIKSPRSAPACFSARHLHFGGEPLRLQAHVVDAPLLDAFGGAAACASSSTSPIEPSALVLSAPGLKLAPCRCECAPKSRGRAS